MHYQKTVHFFCLGSDSEVFIKDLIFTSSAHCILNLLGTFGFLNNCFIGICSISIQEQVNDVGILIFLTDERNNLALSDGKTLCVPAVLLWCLVVVYSIL